MDTLHFAIAIAFATNSSLPHSLALLHHRQALAPQLAHTFEAKVFILINISAKEPFRQDVLHFPPRGRHWPSHTSHVWDPPGSGKLFKLIKGGFVKSKNDCKSDPCGWTRRSHLFDTAREGHSHFHTTEQRRKNISFLFKTLSRATHSPLQDLTEVAFAFSYLRSDICCSQLHSRNSSLRKLKFTHSWTVSRHFPSLWQNLGWAQLKVNQINAQPKAEAF